MKIEPNFALIKSKTAYHNVIRASLEFNLFGRQQFLADCVVDTGCATSLIPAGNIDFGMTSDQAQDKLLFDKNIPIHTGVGVEGHMMDRSKIIECRDYLNKLKAYCREKKFNQAETEKFIRNNCSEQTISYIKNSKFIRYHLPIYDIKVATVNTKTYGLSIAFNVSNDMTLIGMGAIQNLYMQTFSSHGDFYTLLTILDKRRIDRAIAIGTQIREHPVPEIFSDRR